MRKAGQSYLVPDLERNNLKMKVCPTLARFSLTHNEAGTWCPLVCLIVRLILIPGTVEVFILLN